MNQIDKKTGLYLVYENPACFKPEPPTPSICYFEDQSEVLVVSQIDPQTHVLATSATDQSKKAVNAALKKRPVKSFKNNLWTFHDDDPPILIIQSLNQKWAGEIKTILLDANHPQVFYLTFFQIEEI